MEIKHNQPDTEYHSIKAISASGIKTYLKSPRLYEYQVVDGNNKTTKSMSLGTYAHLALLEPTRWEALKIEPDFNKRTKEGKEALAAYQAEVEAKGLQTISQDMFTEAASIRNAVMMHPEAAVLFYDESRKTETSLYWNMDIQGITADCKARIDLYTDEYIVDLKTVSCADKYSFYYSCKDYGYLSQAAWYSHALELATGKRRRFLFLCVETKAPYDLAIYEVPQVILDKELAKIMELLPKMAYSLKNNLYQSKCQGIETLWTPRDYWKDNQEEVYAAI
jgi:hypothetical protein